VCTSVLASGSPACCNRAKSKLVRSVTTTNVGE
jgi:hypothetical protein